MTIDLDKSVIRRARKAKGLSLRKLADQMGVQHNSVAAWERADAAGVIKINTRARALAALGVEPNATPQPGFQNRPVAEPAKLARREERVSYELSRAVAKKLIDDADAVLSVVPGNIEKIRPRVHGSMATEWLDEWQRLSRGSVGAIIDVLLGTDQHSIDMRQNSPFAGALTQQERLEAIGRARQ